VSIENFVEHVDWCNVCNSRPADGKLTVIVDGAPLTLDACEICVYDPNKVVFE